MGPHGSFLHIIIGEGRISSLSIWNFIIYKPHNVSSLTCYIIICWPANKSFYLQLWKYHWYECNTFTGYSTWLLPTFKFQRNKSFFAFVQKQEKHSYLIKSQNRQNPLNSDRSLQRCTNSSLLYQILSNICTCSKVLVENTSCVQEWVDIIIGYIPATWYKHPRAIFVIYQEKGIRPNIVGRFVSRFKFIYIGSMHSRFCICLKWSVAFPHNSQVTAFKWNF